MKANWATFYREGCIASDAAAIVSGLWTNATTDSESEAILQSIWDYLYDRANVCWNFCEVVNGNSIPVGELDESDIPF